ncbi:unnamed protein product [Jaminaea pallidilutea]
MAVGTQEMRATWQGVTAMRPAAEGSLSFQHSISVENDVEVKQLTYGNSYGKGFVVTRTKGRWTRFTRFALLRDGDLRSTSNGSIAVKTTHEQQEQETKHKEQDDSIDQDQKHDMLTEQLPPTSFLPPVRREPPLNVVQDSLEKLESIFLRPIAQTDEEELSSVERLRSDTHEKDYAVSWLNRLLDSQLLWLQASIQESNDGNGCDGSIHPDAILERLLDRIAGVSSRITASSCDGMSLQDDEPMERVFRFPFDFDRLAAGSSTPSRSSRVAKRPELGTDIVVTLLDEPLPPSGGAVAPQQDVSSSKSDRADLVGGAEGKPQSASLEASTAVGVQTWAAAIVLSDLIVTDPCKIHRHLDPRSRRRPLRVAELGAGTGLVGIVCAKWLEQQRSADTESNVGPRETLLPDYVVLTDYHERVLENLRRNIAANRASETTSIPQPNHLPPPVDMGFAQLDWSHYHGSEALSASPNPALQPFDLLLAADVVYAREHAAWLYSAMSALLACPPERSSSGGAHVENNDEDQDGVVEPLAHVVNAKRVQGRFGEWDLIGRTDEAFGPVWSPSERANPSASEQRRLRVIRRIELPKRKGLGRVDESGHVWWTLGWR